MGELTSYRLSDFILFSESAYYRQFELYNQAVWPLHVLSIILGLVILYVLRRRPAWAGRYISAVLIAGWAWVAYAFLYQRFYQIHVVADLYALAFLLQAGLVVWYGLFKDRFIRKSDNRIVIIAGLIMLAIGFVFYPFIALMSGRNWQQFELFALAPDPTAVATLGIFLLLRAPFILFVIPLVWLMISITTQIVM